MNRTHQVVFCSDDIGRAFLVTIAYTQTHAVVTDCEKILPDYEIAMQRMRGADEGVVKLENLQMDTTKRRCPFCGNRGVVHCCECGALSCCNRDKFLVECPKCHFAGGHSPVPYLLTSQSGFVDGPDTPPHALPRSRAPAPVPRVTASYWQKAKERQQRIAEVKERGKPALLPAPSRPGAVPLLPYYKK